MRKTFRTLLTAIMIFAIAVTSAPMLSVVLGQSASAVGTAFSLNLVSETDTEAVISVNLESGSFMNATIALKIESDSEKCTKIAKGDAYKAEEIRIEDLGGIMSYAANASINRVAVISTEELTKRGAYFLFTVEKSSDIVPLHKILNFTVEDIEATIVNNIPKGESGKCGTNLTWTLDYDTGLLKISGTGTMTNRSSGNSPFYGNKRIKAVAIEKGVTSIGDYAFENCVNLATINFPDTLKTVGKYALKNCTAFSGVPATNKIEVIGDGAFNGCEKITTITLCTGFKSIGADAFEGTGLKTVSYMSTKYRWSKVEKATTNAKFNSATLTFTGLELGDINDDGNINSTDALIVLKDVVELEKIPSEHRTSADTTKDGKVNSNDALQILLFTVGKITKF